MDPGDQERAGGEAYPNQAGLEDGAGLGNLLQRVAGMDTGPRHPGRPLSDAMWEQAVETLPGQGIARLRGDLGEHHHLRLAHRGDHLVGIGLAELQIERGHPHLGAVPGLVGEQIGSHPDQVAGHRQRAQSRRQCRPHPLAGAQRRQRAEQADRRHQPANQAEMDEGGQVGEPGVAELQPGERTEQRQRARTGAEQGAQAQHPRHEHSAGVAGGRGHASTVTDRGVTAVNPISKIGP
ncbi:hypothetical protein HJ590_12800 [Naumannella sp. ID2617S]|nr:hypothetical protein [Naumannella sp. ID2617S]